MDGVLEGVVDGHVRAGQPQLLQDVQAARVLGVRADCEACAAGGVGSEFVQGDGPDGFGTEPEEDHVGDPQVLILPGGLLPCRFHLPDREGGAARVEHDGRRADRIQLEHRAALPAAVLARTLGIDITLAVKWQRAAAGDWAAYAAEVSM